jgi:6-pyruvoyltetrahydropterin/6-carboxytetrahydropterin synthase
MPIVYLTRRERFSSAHRLFNPGLSDEQNFRVFGQCSHPNWHGHNYELFVTVKGEVNPELGYAVNAKEVSRVVHELIVVKLDHRNINLDVDFMKGKLASTENLAISIWNELQKPLAAIGAILHCIRIAETENNFVEYYGE